MGGALGYSYGSRQPGVGAGSGSTGGLGFGSGGGAGAAGVGAASPRGVAVKPGGSWGGVGLGGGDGGVLGVAARRGSQPELPAAAGAASAALGGPGR
jgi:hypothetical protein